MNPPSHPDIDFVLSLYEFEYNRYHMSWDVRRKDNGELVEVNYGPKQWAEDYVLSQYHNIKRA